VAEEPTTAFIQRHLEKLAGGAAAEPVRNVRRPATERQSFALASQHMAGDRMTWPAA
jgi:hypothetical protein